MKFKLLLLVVVAACGFGAYRHATSEGDPLERLLTVPESFPAGTTGGIEVISAGPNAEQNCVPGRFTVLAFYSDSCPGCRKLQQHFQRFRALRRDVAIRLVDLGNRWGNKNYKALYGTSIRSVPHVMIYDPEAKLIAGDEGTDKAGLELLYDWMNAEIRRDFESR